MTGDWDSTAIRIHRIQTACEGSHAKGDVMSFRALVSSTRLFGYVTLAALIVGPSPAALAIATATAFADTPPCDVLVGPSVLDELGFPATGFPGGEQLAATDGLVNNPVCLATKIAGQADTQVRMQNLNSISFS